MSDRLTARRELLIMAALPWAMAGEAQAEVLDKRETMITLPDQIAWETPPGGPPDGVAMARLFGNRNGSGIYASLSAGIPAI